MSAILSAIVLFQVLALSAAVLALAADNRPAMRSNALNAAHYPTATAAAAVVEDMTEVERILTTPVAARPAATAAAFAATSAGTQARDVTRAA